MPSAKKVMTMVFSDHQSVLLVDFLTHGAAVNATSYCATLDRLRKAIIQKRPRLHSKGFLLLVDNVLSLTTSLTLGLVRRDVPDGMGWDIQYTIQHGSRTK